MVTADLDEGPIIELDVERVDFSHAVVGLGLGLGQDLECRALARAVRWPARSAGPPSAASWSTGNRTGVFR